MRLLTNLMAAGALIFGFILVEHHYRIADRLWQFRSSGTTQPSVPAVPASPGWNVTPDDHDYKVIIDVSGKGPFMTVVHGPDPVVKKGTKKSKKATPSQQV